MPLCGVTKQWNSICCNFLAKTPVKTHFHKRSRRLHLLKKEQDFSTEKETRELCVFVRVCAASSTQPLCGIYFHAKACFCLAAERRYYLPSYTKLLHTWQFIFCMISQKSIRSCKDKYEIAAANWCGLGGTPLIMLSGRVGLGLSLGLPSKSSCINKISRWSMNEFTAGSAVITHGSARSKSLACVKTVGGINGGTTFWEAVSAQLQGEGQDVVVDQMRMQHCVMNENNLAF